MPRQRVAATESRPAASNIKLVVVLPDGIRLRRPVDPEPFELVCIGQENAIALEIVGNSVAVGFQVPYEVADALAFAVVGAAIDALRTDEVEGGDELLGQLDGLLYLEVAWRGLVAERASTSRLARDRTERVCVDRRLRLSLGGGGGDGAGNALRWALLDGIEGSEG